MTGCAAIAGPPRPGCVIGAFTLTGAAAGTTGCVDGAAAGWADALVAPTPVGTGGAFGTATFAALGGGGWLIGRGMLGGAPDGGLICLGAAPRRGKPTMGSPFQSF